MGAEAVPEDLKVSPPLKEEPALKLIVSPALKVRFATAERLFQGELEDVPLFESEPAALST